MFWRYGRPRTLWKEMEQLRNEMDRVFTGVRRSPSLYPAMNVWSGEDKLIVTAELPGLNAENVDVSVVGRSLTIQGKHETGDEERTYHRRERATGNFSRSLELPYLVDRDRIEAKMEKGVLYVTLPRAEADKPRKIEVRAG